MTAAVHPAAPDHLPPFITAPGETDVLMVVTAVIVVLAVLGFGLLFLRIHTLPERIAHKGHKLQFEIVGSSFSSAPWRRSFRTIAMCRESGSAGK